MSTDVLRLASTAATHDSVTDAVDIACTHCGLPVPPGLVQEGREQQFCCTGCTTAFAILQDHGLGRYYDFAEKRETPVRSSERDYQEFDHPAFAERYVRTGADGLSRIELYLEGVHCASCVWLVERVPLIIPGVQRAELDVRRALAVVEWDRARVSLSSIARTLDRLGYAPHPFRGVLRDAMRTREDRAMLIRIGVSGAIAINIMLAALALYSGELNGMEAQFTRLFRWISFGLTVPAIVWPGRLFFTGAWASFRTRSLHMDLPIALALAVGFVRGAINTITDSGPIYFDGLAVLIFALLVGRYLQQRGQRTAADAAELLHSIAPTSARVVDESGVHIVPSDALLPGMVLDVRAGDSFAADGVVIDGRSTVNASLLTGESRPVSVASGEAVFAGTQNVEAPLRVRVERAGEQSRVAKLMALVEDSARRRAPVVQMANRVAGWFVAAVLTAAVVTWAIKAQMHSAQALDDAIALLIVTCPCALALATPLAITVAVGRAAGRGMLIKGGDALELLSTPATLVLDKTGTITEGSMAVVTWVGPEWVKPLVLALEAGSSHPIADGFRRAFPDALATTQVVVQSSRHVAGAGLEGVVGGRTVRIGSPRFVHEATTTVDSSLSDRVDAIDATLTPVVIAVDGVVVAAAGLGDRVRDDARLSLETLRRRGWRTIMLSGDAPEVVQAVGSALGFAADEMIGGASPEDKLAFVERLKPHGHVVMVGDGVNDAAAIAAAHVGIGVHGGAEACLSTADIYLTQPGLSALVELTDGAQRTMGIIRRNMAFSLGYNVIGASLAIAGVLSPLIAAVLMPLSSLTVLVGSWHGRSFSRERVGGVS